MSENSSRDLIYQSKTFFVFCSSILDLEENQINFKIHMNRNTFIGDVFKEIDTEEIINNARTSKKPLSTDCNICNIMLQ